MDTELRPLIVKLEILGAGGLIKIFQFVYDPQTCHHSLPWNKSDIFSAHNLAHLLL